MPADDRKIKQQSEVRGVGSNPGLLVDSYEMKGPDGYLIYDQELEAKNETGFIGGEAVRADGPGKKIVQTPWLAAGTIRDTMTVTLAFETDTTSEGTSIVSGTRVLRGKIFKRNAKTKEIIRSYQIGWIYTSTKSKYPGMKSQLVDSEQYALQYFSFTPQHEYRIEIETMPSLESHQSIIIDYLYFEFVNTSSWQFPFQSAFAGYDDSDIDGVVAIPCLEAATVSIPLNASGDGSAVVNPATITAGTGGSDNYFYGSYNAVWGAFFQPSDQNGADSTEVNVGTSAVGDGGYNFTVIVNTAFGGGTLSGDLLIVGMKFPVRI